MNQELALSPPMTARVLRTLLHLSAFYASAMVPLLSVMAMFILMPESSIHDAPLSLAKCFWFTGGIFVVFNLIGILMGSPWHSEQELKQTYQGWNQHKKLVIAYVSRGDNAVALARAIERSRAVLDAMQINYEIEAITDIPVQVTADRFYLVPNSYATKGGAKYKARALHYASENRPAHKDSWILHMDEESIVTAQVIRGLDKFINASTKIGRIGQGEIKYNAYKYGQNILITAIDAIRTGDDIGRFRVQYKLFKKPLFGMHGSFFVVNSLLEKHVGFDLGRKGSITEDAYFALICSQKGVRFEWVDGFIQEQSPFTLLALLKQRRRWITGLWLLMFDKSVQRRQRAVLGLNMVLWRLAWIGPLVTCANYILGGSLLPYGASLMATLLAGMVGVVYMAGAYRNVTDIGMHPARQLVIWSLSGVLVPVSCMVEGLAVLYSIVRPIKTFEVVKK